LSQPKASSRLPGIALQILIFAMPANLAAQQPPAISVDVNVVSLLATVHDRDGRSVKNLAASDFKLQEDGVPQTIRYFSHESDLPLTIGLLVDTSRSQTTVLQQEGSASYAFLDQVLREGKDQAFVMSFDIHVQTLQGLTSSRTELASGLDQLRVPQDFGTLINSAVRDSSQNLMREQPGRKALILLTDGDEHRDPASLETAIEFAQRSDTIIYAILFSGASPFARPGRAAIRVAAKKRGKQAMQRMAKETGGVCYEVTKHQSIEAIYAQIEDALRNQYSFGYTPERPAADGKYHKIKLTTTDRHHIVGARDGYYAG